MSESIQHRLTRVRPPRVKITYDVEIGDAIQKKELPFIVGIIADLSGKAPKSPEKLKDRKFVEIDRDNFDTVLGAIAPTVAFQVDNKLQPGPDAGKFNVQLTFTKMADFEPAAVVEQVAALKPLYDARNRLRDLLAKLDGNDELDQILRDLLAHGDQQEKLRGELKAIEQAPAKDATAATTQTTG